MRQKYKEAGINTYVALWKGPSQEQVDALKGLGMKLVCHQNEFGLKQKDDATIIAWMHGDEPDNAQSKQGGGYGPPSFPKRSSRTIRRCTTPTRRVP